MISLTMLLADGRARRHRHAEHPATATAPTGPMVRITLPAATAREIYAEAPYHGAHALKEAVRPYIYHGGHPYIAVTDRDLIRHILRSSAAA